MTGSVEVRSYRPVLDSEALADLRGRLRNARLPAGVGEGWEQGVQAGWLHDVLTGWSGFDLASLQDRLDALSHVRADVDGQVLHAVVAP